MKFIPSITMQAHPKLSACQTHRGKTQIGAAGRWGRSTTGPGSGSPLTSDRFRAGCRGFTLVEIMISLTICMAVMGMCVSTFIYGLRTAYKDTERLKTNGSLRAFMSQISKETLDASFFYLLPSYSGLDGSINLATDVVPMTQIDNAADDDYDKWVGHGDCLVLVTNTSTFRTTDIRQIRIYYRLAVNQAGRNAESELRYFETADWGEGPPDDNNPATTETNGRSNITTELNLINLNANPNLTGSRRITTRTKGRLVPAPYLPYAMNDRYPIFCSEAPDSTTANAFVAVNVEFINGGTKDNIISSSSFNYTISPRR